MRMSRCISEVANLAFRKGVDEGALWVCAFLLRPVLVLCIEQNSGEARKPQRCPFL